MEYQHIYEHPKLNDVLVDLVQLFIKGDSAQNIISKERYSAAAWAASSLSNSVVSLHKKKAFLFASLSKKVYQEDLNIDVLCYSIFSRTGNIPSTRHLSFLFESNKCSKNLLGAIELEFIKSYTESISRFSDNLTLTSFQSRVEESLIEDFSGLFTAPTSAGKSFIVHEYAKYQLSQDQEFLCLFIVPTKALISQFSSIYRGFRLEKDLAFNVYTSVPDSLSVDIKKSVFCLTQERCIKLLSSKMRDKLSFVFVDEIQKVEDKGRGALLEYVINEIQRYSSKAKMFFAGPYISNANSLSDSLSLNIKDPISTEDSPVSQIVLMVKPIKNQNKLELSLLTDNQEDKYVSFNCDVDKKYYSRWRSQTAAIVDAVDIFASDSPSIAYAPGPATARNWAVEYASKWAVQEDPNRDLCELIEYVRDSIHPQCSLIYCLQRGVAYHHGKLPDFIREEVEELFSSRVVKILFCTSTLLEGVNLPADKIFVINPSKGSEGLSLFEFRNLIGRAGRLSEHLNGIVYCIHSSGDSEDDWLDEYKNFENSHVETYIDKKLIFNLDKIKKAIDNNDIILRSEDSDDIRYTLTILRSRYLIDEEYALKYIRRKSLSDDDKDYISESLKASVNKLSLPPELAEKSPYVDPILQEKLYRTVSENPLDWNIRRQSGFSTDFKYVFKNLDKIFSIVNECRPHSNYEFQDEIIIGYAKDWLNGESFSRIVKRALPSKYKEAQSIPHKDVDDAVQRAFNFITNDVSFVTAKYFSVLSEILKYILSDDDVENFSFTISLPVMLELGSRDPKQLSLITACIPRGAALNIAKLIPDVDDPVEWLTANQQKKELQQQLPRLYRRILKRVGIWK